jgi:serine phosphatase RsbU (regulator of sigma subunit)
MLILLAPGMMAFLIACISVADMFVPRPWDGVELEADSPGQLVVRRVSPGSGADVAGIRPADVIVGVARERVRTPGRVQELLNQHRFGDKIPYLIRTGGNNTPIGHMITLEVELGHRRIGSTSYLFACFLGLTFFLIGTFVVVRQPRLPASRVFSTMCSLFLLFLVCRLRPASYSWMDRVVLTTGTVALLFLPATFLHFFLIFPRSVWEWRRDFAARLVGWVSRFSSQLIPFYVIPPMVYALTIIWSRHQGSPLALISGAPATNWWVMVVYMVLGLGVLGVSAAYLPDQRQRRGAGLVFLGTLFGVVPFMILTVAFPSFLHTEQYISFGVAPLLLVPVTFAYAIIRFGLLNIRVILRKSLLYTVSSALVTAIYAFGIALSNYLFRGTELASQPYFPIVFALVIVILFEPLRHRIQGPVDRFFFAERSRLQQAIQEMGEAFSVQMDLGPVVRELVERMPGLLGLHFAALYLLSDGQLRRRAGPESLPETLTNISVVRDFLHRQGGLVRLSQLAPLQLISPQVERLGKTLGEVGVDMIGLLASPRRTIGVVLLSGTTGQTTLEHDEFELLRGLLHQASIALETNILLEERTRRAELDRELKIAATIQDSMLPKQVPIAGGWQVVPICRPAHEVGGDFYTELPGATPGERALAYGDVSGKSISGALIMMAAHEVLNALALAHPDPEELFQLANERLYTLRGLASSLQGGSFVALGYLGFVPDGTLRYSLAGQPPPLLRRAGGELIELQMPKHRVPLGAIRRGGHSLLTEKVGIGDLLLAYSDGVIEAQSPSGEFFGEERLRRVIMSCPIDPEQASKQVLAALEDFTSGSKPYDDLTLIAARWVGK